uniref:C-type lectin domain-containing protein n=1 Tax=Caenorhabditis japonica TaxID=281687 RepID=A0A8R1DRX9_CAEJA
MSKRLTLLLLLISSLIFTSAEDISDASFIRFCDTQDGIYTPKGKGAKSANGNTCEIPFIHWAKTEKLRWEFCTEYLPHTVLETKVVDKYTYTCLVESRVACDDGWIQLHGICHKLIYEAVTKPEARARCQKERANARIATYHRPYMTRHWQDFFRDAIKLWVDATETITDRLIYKRGPELMFAHDTMEYGLHSGAFVMVKSHKRAWPLCAYTPPVTQSQSDYLMTRYGEIYYNTILSPSGDRYIRSASGLQRDSNNRDAERQYCENLMKPVLRPLNAQSALPTRGLIDSISRDTPLKNTLIRFSAHSGDSSMYNRISESCTQSEAKNFGMNLYAKKEKKTFFMRIPAEHQDAWKDGEPKETRGQPGLEAMSDARHAPIYCQSLFETIKYKDCPKGWSTYERKTIGQRWCHKFFADLKSQPDAEKTCVQNDAHLDGFEDEAELLFLDEMLTASKIDFTTKYNGYVGWLGAKRREACKNELNGFNRDSNHQCSRRRVFEWVYGVARNSPEFDKHWASPSEPNLAGNEQCLEILKGHSSQFGYGGRGLTAVTRKINDAPCDIKRMFFCGKEAETVVVPLANT